MRYAISLFAAVAPLLSATVAQAYVLETTPKGAPLRFHQPEITVVVDRTVATLGADAEEAVTEAFAAWTSADAAVPSVTLVDGDADAVGYDPSGENQNTVRYLADGYAPAGMDLAVTVTTFDTHGTLLDADIVFNGALGRSFAIFDPRTVTPRSVDVVVPYDFQNVLTHEVGHVFGLADETTNPDATMFITSARGETKKRDLAADDIAGVQAVYEAGASTTTIISCDVTGMRSRAPARPFVLVAIGAVAFAVARRRRALAAAIPVGVALALFAASAPAAPPVQTMSTAPAAANTVHATVTSVDAYWEGGLLVSSIEIDADSHANGGHAYGRVEVLGGRLDGVTQIVSGRSLPALGATIELPRSSHGILWPAHFALRRDDPEGARPVIRTDRE